MKVSPRAPGTMQSVVSSFWGSTATSHFPSAPRRAAEMLHQVIQRGGFSMLPCSPGQNRADAEGHPISALSHKPLDLRARINAASACCKSYGNKQLADNECAQARRLTICFPWGAFQVLETSSETARLGGALAHAHHGSGFQDMPSPSKLPRVRA